MESISPIAKATHDGMVELSTPVGKFPLSMVQADHFHVRLRNYVYACEKLKSGLDLSDSEESMLMGNENIEHINQDKLRLFINGTGIDLSLEDAKLYSAHLQNECAILRMAVDGGYVPELLDYQLPPKHPKSLIPKWKRYVDKIYDREGKRFWIAALYLLADDHAGALIFCRKFTKRCRKIESSYSDPAFLLTYIVALYRSENELQKRLGGQDSFGEISHDSTIAQLLYSLHLANPYLIDMVLFKDIDPLDGRRHPTNISSFGWANSIPIWLKNLVDGELRESIFEFTQTYSFQHFLKAELYLNKRTIGTGDRELDEYVAFKERYSQLDD